MIRFAENLRLSFPYRRKTVNNLPFRLVHISVTMQGKAFSINICKPETNQGGHVELKLVHFGTIF